MVAPDLSVNVPMLRQLVWAAGQGGKWKKQGAQQGRGCHKRWANETILKLRRWLFTIETSTRLKIQRLGLEERGEEEPRRGRGGRNARSISKDDDARSRKRTASGIPGLDRPQSTTQTGYKSDNKEVRAHCQRYK